MAFVAVLLLAAACQSGSAAKPSSSTPHVAAATSAWRAVEAPLPQGERGVTFDPARGVFWTLNREFGPGGGAGRMSLERFDPAVDAWFATSVNLDASGFTKGLVQVAPDGRIWIGWGRTLARYDPATDTVAAWPLPPQSAGAWSTDGRMVAMLPDGQGEVWVATEPLHALFGFSVTSARWDRTIRLPFEATEWSKIVEAGPSKLFMNGVLVRGNDARSLLAGVDTKTSAATLLPPHARDYVVDGTSLVYLDDASSLHAFNLVSRVDSPVVRSLPAGWPANLAIDPDGRLWFSVAAYRYLGVGRVDLESGFVTTYPFPYIDRPGQHDTQVNTCPPAAFDCVPPDAIAGVLVQDIGFDSAGSVWIFTDMGGALPDLLHTPSTLYELVPR